MSTRNTSISEEMQRLMRESIADLDESDKSSMAPIREMAPHYMSRDSNLPTNGMVYMFPVDIDGDVLHVYLKQS